MATVLDALGRRDDSLAKIDAALAVSKLKPKRFWIQKADLLTSWQRHAEAIECCVKARTLDPKYATAWRKEVELRKMTNDKVGYVTALKAYLDLVPTDLQARKELDGIKVQSKDK